MSNGSSDWAVSSERASAAALGYMAEDVVLATFEYPTISARGSAALDKFADLLRSFSEVPDAGLVVMAEPTQMRMAALSDSLNERPLHLSGPNSQDTATRLQEATRTVLRGEATPDQLADVRDSAESLGMLTLDRLLELRNRRSSPWTSRISHSS